LFLILDKPSRDEDERLAEHVTYVHMHNRHPDLDVNVVDPAIMRYYIALARQRRPTVSREVSSYVVDSYVRTSARTLLGVLRLAQALARLRWSDAVEHSDVDEALRLMECSKESLQDEDDKEPDLDKSPISQIFRLIKSMVGSGDKGSKRSQRLKRLGKGPGGERDMDIDSEEEDSTVLSMTEIRARVLSSGYNEVQLMETIATYEDLEIWVRVANNSKIQFI